MEACGWILEIQQRVTQMSRDVLAGPSGVVLRQSISTLEALYHHHRRLCCRQLRLYARTCFGPDGSSAGFIFSSFFFPVHRRDVTQRSGKSKDVRKDRACRRRKLIINERGLGRDAEIWSDVDTIGTLGRYELGMPNSHRRHPCD